MVHWPLSLAEKNVKLAPFRFIAPLYEKLTAYLAKKLTFATPGPVTADGPRSGHVSRRRAGACAPRADRSGATRDENRDQG